MKINELLTIIIPSRNIDYLLEECIRNIRKFYNDTKIIIILDETEKNSSFNSDENIIILTSDNLNMSAKRNLGAAHSNTKYIAFLDSDSYPANENWARGGVKFLEENPLYCAVTGKQLNPPSDNFEQRCLRLVRYSPHFTHKEWCIVFDKTIKECDVTEFTTSNVIMRHEVYINTGGMNKDIYLAEDNEFSQRLVNKGHKIRFIPNISVFHRESTLYSFLRKIYCMSYYYANMFVKGRHIKNVKNTIVQFVPLISCIMFCIAWTILYKLNMNPFILLILPVCIFILLINEAVNCALNLERNKIKGFLLILFTFCIFIAIWIIGTFLGSINFPTKNIQKCYKHY